MDVSLLHDRKQCTFVPAPRFQQAREVRALAELGDLQLQGADPGVPLPVSIAIAIGRPTRRALVRLGADQVGHLGIHQLLRDWEEPLAHLSEIDWRKTNPEWQGICMLGSDVVTRRQTKDATAQYIKWQLGLTSSKPQTVLATAAA